jgi:hypothetical protein
MAEERNLIKDEDLILDSDDERMVNGLTMVQRELLLNERYKKVKDNQFNSNVEKIIMEKGQITENFTKQPKITPKYPECDFLVPRDLILKNVFKPFFNKLKGSFVRAAINNKHTVCKIVGFEKVPKYQLFGKESYSCTTGLNLDSGKKIINGFQINSISSQNATEEEFNDFISIFEISSLDSIRHHFKNLKETFSRSMTDAEVTQFLRNRTEDNPIKKTNTQRKIEIISKRDEAIQSRNKEQALVYQRQLEQIEDEERSERKKKMMEESEVHKKKCL